MLCKRTLEPFASKTVGFGSDFLHKKPGIWILSIGEAAATFGTQDCSASALKMGGGYMGVSKNRGTPKMDGL